MKLGLIPLGCILLFSAPLVAQPVVIPVMEDSYVIKSDANTAHFDKPIMPVSRSDKEDHAQILLNFDLRPYEGRLLSNAKLRFKIVEANQSPQNDAGQYFIKALRVMPEVDLLNTTFNHFKFLQRQASPNVLKSYQYDVIHTFADAYTATSQQEAQYRAAIVREPVGKKAFVTVDLGNKLQSLAGTVITLVVEDYRSSKPFLIYSKESVEPEKPTLVVELEPKPASILPSRAKVTSILQGEPFGIVHNGLTGLHQWDDKNFNPNFKPANDVYKRYFWDELESLTGEDKLITLVNAIRQLNPGQKYAFRVRAMRDYGENHLPADLAHLVKDCEVIVNNNRVIFKVPDWESAELRDRAAQFWQALYSRLNEENLLTKIAWVDMGFIGRFGENNGACVDSVPRKFLDEYVDIYLNTFANSSVQLVSMSDNDGMLQRALAANISIPVGVRRDSLGGDTTHFDALARQFNAWPQAHTRWQQAPFIAEFGGKINSHDSMWALSPIEVEAWHVATVGNGNTVAGNSIDNNPFTNPDLAQYKDEFDQIGRLAGHRTSMDKWAVPTAITVDKPFFLYTAWNNRGSAPAYEDYTAYVLFYQNARFVKEIPLSINFRHLLPTWNRITGINYPFEVMDHAQLALPGAYDLYLQVRSNDGSRPMMKLNQHTYRLLPQPVVGEWLGTLYVNK
jgi:hypothetical protein